MRSIEDEFGIRGKKYATVGKPGFVKTQVQVRRGYYARTMLLVSRMTVRISFLALYS